MGRENSTPKGRSKSNDIISRALKWLAFTSEGDKTRTNSIRGNSVLQAHLTH